MSKIPECLESLIAEYERQLHNLTVMDDYDGGMANQLRRVIDDLRKLDTTQFSKSWYEKETQKAIDLVKGKKDEKIS